METTVLNAYLVDDEPLARQRLRLLSQQEPDLELLAECDRGTAALL